MKAHTKAEYHRLIEEIRQHDRHYYLEAQPTISDYEYDQLLKKLEVLEKEHPDWITSSSPTQRVGEMLTKGFKQVAHAVPMLSLDNTYSSEELADFIKRVHKLLERTHVEFCTELKMDGVAITAHYEKGLFVRGVTRGDGRKGDDVTHNLKTIRSLPLELTGSHIPESLEVRGEVFMPHKEFQKQNALKEQVGEEPWANPRNAAAGSLKLLDPHEAAKRGLNVVFYGIAEESSHKVISQFACHEFLKKLGLPVFAEAHRDLCKNIDEIMAFADKIEKKRHSLPFDIDGIVIKVDDIRLWDGLGTTGRSPRWAVAYKFAPEQAGTRIRDITVQVGRTGVLTPVAELESVSLAGSTISRATLHNQEEVERKDIRIGDWALIEKGGDVIPKVVSIDPKKRPHGSKPWKMPKSCPSCGTHVVHTPGEVAVRCPNSRSCPEQVIRRIAYFASKDAMDIGHMGEKVVEQLVNKGLVKTFSDIYTLSEKDLAKLEGFKEKSIANLLESIDKSRHVPFYRLILALGIKYVGEETAELLADEAKEIDKLAKMSEEDLVRIEGIGEKTAEAIVEYFSVPAHLKEIHALLKNGVAPQKPKALAHTGHPFFGKVFVLTGTLKDFSRSEASQHIKDRGGKVSDSVTRKTDYLVVGEDPGSKLDKAKELKIHILSESEFKKQL